MIINGLLHLLEPKNFCKDSFLCWKLVDGCWVLGVKKGGTDHIFKNSKVGSLCQRFDLVRCTDVYA